MPNSYRPFRGPVPSCVGGCVVLCGRMCGRLFAVLHDVAPCRMKSERMAEKAKILENANKNGPET